MIRLRLFLWSALVVGLVSGCRAPSANDSRPSVVMILVDTLRADYLGTYGFQGDVSPHIDALGRDGVVFEKCFSQSPWTKPSVATLFTGLYPSVHKVYTEEGKFHAKRGADRSTDALSRDAVTLAEVLSDRGYSNAAFVANPWIRAAHGFDQGFAKFDTEGADNDQKATVLVGRAKQWLDQLRTDAPFFLYVHMMDVHAPYDAPQEDFEAVRNSPSLGPSVPLDKQLFDRIPAYMKIPDWTKGPDAADVRVWRGRYAAGVRFIDRAIGDLVEHLRRTGRYDDTLLVIVSDHGEELYDHGAWDHGYRVYDHQIHVPLVVRYPRSQFAGTRVAGVSRVVDLMPTVLSAAGAPLPPLLQGTDLAGLVRGADERRVSVTEAVKWAPEMRVARSVSHKLVSRGAAQQLYDVAHDPREMEDVRTRQADVASQLAAALSAYESANRAHPGLAATQAEVPAEVQERLRSLGYLE